MAVSYIVSAAEASVASRCAFQQAEGKVFLTKSYNGVSLSHSQMCHYSISYLPTCEVDLFEVLEILTLKWHYIIYFSHKSTKVICARIESRLKKI